MRRVSKISNLLLSSGEWGSYRIDVISGGERLSSNRSPRTSESSILTLGRPVIILDFCVSRFFCTRLSFRLRLWWCGRNSSTCTLYRVDMYASPWE